MSVPESECPHLDTRSISSYHWRHNYCADCGSEWRSPLGSPPAPPEEVSDAE